MGWSWWVPGGGGRATARTTGIWQGSSSDRYRSQALVVAAVAAVAVGPTAVGLTTDLRKKLVSGQHLPQRGTEPRQHFYPLLCPTRHSRRFLQRRMSEVTPLRFTQPASRLSHRTMT